jgi:hypothetical protein
MFANESGVYCLRRNQAIEYIGKYMERNWTERVDLDMLSIVQGHHYGVGRTYKLSVPLVDETANSEVYVYNHTGEAEGKPGAWGRYDNHPATGWANLASNAYFGATSGRVFSVRNMGEASDYRDDNVGIEFDLRTRPTDFGDAEKRKVIDAVVANYRVGGTSTSTAVLFSGDTEQEYQETTDFRIVKPAVTTGLSDPVTKDISTLVHSIGRRRCVYASVEVTNSAIDENIEVAGITYKVAGLEGGKGIEMAGDTE